MSHRLAILLLSAAFAGVAVLPSAASAQDVPPQVTALQQLVGTWNGAGTVTGPEGAMELQMIFVCESVADGLGVLCRDEMTGGPGGTMHAVHLFGYDPGDGLVHWYSVTSGAETHDHAGGFVDNTLTLMHSGPMEGQLFTESISITFDGDTATGTSTVSLGGQQLGVLNMSMTKAPAE